MEPKMSAKEFRAKATEAADRTLSEDETEAYAALVELTTLLADRYVRPDGSFDLELQLADEAEAPEEDA